MIKPLTDKQIPTCFKELEQVTKLQRVLILIISIGVDANIITMLFIVIIVGVNGL